MSIDTLVAGLSCQVAVDRSGGAVAADLVQRRQVVADPLELAARLGYSGGCGGDGTGTFQRTQRVASRRRFRPGAAEIQRRHGEQHLVGDGACVEDSFFIFLHLGLWNRFFFDRTDRNRPPFGR